MAEIIYDDGADLSLIQSKKVAIIGYGSQGHAHALNLKDSGVDVVVGLRPGSSSWAKAEAAGWRLRTWPRPSPRVTSSPCCCPTRSSATSTPSRLHPQPEEGAALLFAHGFNIRYGYIEVPEGPRRHHGRPQGPRP